MNVSEKFIDKHTIVVENSFLSEEMEDDKKKKIMRRVYYALGAGSASAGLIVALKKRENIIVALRKLKSRLAALSQEITDKARRRLEEVRIKREMKRLEKRLADDFKFIEQELNKMFG